MKYFITLSDQAQEDLEETNDYYLKKSHSLLDKFWNDLDKTLARLSENPLQFQERYKGNRIVFLEYFPFGVHYFLNGKEIEVFRILHTKRKF
ncbi:type II toxin-antitoxin system RelE/ParE family toxin [Kaistella flava (ex Peng et al. 2021)]|uniref:Type II toxin-antitoxin system RelE/ParE family toxin n=1 Tax=Kaistella flava (ex Peng et al. 2021) TaxID=2038776 RepID=A0A7M2YBL7_9FLAO|nr:type II toxin-antitoxin system RelE/ParE family toxin [Kaistella flava (ex Peng et al. 2021)]QOW10994.1 type II toxin-antitoxin system RelE/ParE family toxin [Kaistella flava (ex Peng et al. 2021)]